MACYTGGIMFMKSTSLSPVPHTLSSYTGTALTPCTMWNVHWGPLQCPHDLGHAWILSAVLRDGPRTSGTSIQGNLLDIQVTRSLLNQKLWKETLECDLTSPPGDSNTPYNLRTFALHTVVGRSRVKRGSEPCLRWGRVGSIVAEKITAYVYGLTS